MHEEKEEAVALPLGRSLAASAGVTAGATLLLGGVAQAACTCKVDSLADLPDPGHTTLRDAVTSSQAPGNSGSTITFASSLSGTISLGSPLPDINYPTVISGPGPGVLTVDAQEVGRVFTILANSNDDPETISGLTITGGVTLGDSDRGAGIYSNGAALAIDNAVITGNHTADTDGGGVAAYGGSLTITNSTISGNVANGGFGGGVFTYSGSGAEATIRSSTISGNQANYGGGAYFEYSAPASVENSTIYGNIANGAGGGIFSFGPYAPGAGLTLTSTTINHNTAEDHGGGLASFGASYNGNDLTPPTLRNTIVAGNTANSGPDLSTTTPGSMNAAFSLIGQVAQDTTVTHTGQNFIGPDPLLGPLTNNGGPTATQRPSIHSAAVEQGASFGLTTDQRGSVRPFVIPSIASAPGGDGSDIGAVELQASELPSNAFTTKLKGKKLLITVASPGIVHISDARAPLNPSAAKRRKPALNPSVSGGDPPTITATLRLTKSAKQRLRTKGKLTVNARITFTPNRGLSRTQTAKLKIRARKIK